MGYDPKEKVKCPKCPRKIRRDGLSTHLKIHQKKERQAGSVETLFRRHADAQDEDVSRPTSPQSSMPQSSNISGGISGGIGMGTPVRSLSAYLFGISRVWSIPQDGRLLHTLGEYHL